VSGDSRHHPISNMKQLILYIIFLMSMVFAGYGEVSAASVSFTSDALPKKDKLTKVEYDQRQSDAQLENASELAYRICSSRPQRLLPSGNMHGNQSASRLLSNRIHLLFTLLSAIEGAMEPFRQETAPIHFDVASKYYVICLRHLIC
jgi:hypothetical protein